MRFDVALTGALLRHPKIAICLAVLVLGSVTASCGEGVFDPATTDAAGADAGGVTADTKAYTKAQYDDWRQRFENEEDFQEVKLREGVVTLSQAQADSAVVEWSQITFPAAGNADLLKLSAGTTIFAPRADPVARKAAGGTNAFGFACKVVKVSKNGGTIVIDTQRIALGELLEGAVQVTQVPENLVVVDTTGVDVLRYFPPSSDDLGLDSTKEIQIDPFELGGEFSTNFGASVKLPALNMKLSKGFPNGSVDIAAVVDATLKIGFKPTVVAKFIFGYFSLDYMKLALGIDFIVGAALDYDASVSVTLKVDNEKATPDEKLKAGAAAGPGKDNKKFSLAKVGPFVGPTLGPVPTTWQIRFVAECAITIAGTAKGHSEGELGAGAQFGLEYDGELKPFAKGNFTTSTSNDINVGGSIGVECGIEPRFEWLVANIGGPWLGVRGSVGANLAYNTECEDPTEIPKQKQADASLAAWVGAGLAVKFGLAADLGFFGSFEKVLATFVDKKWTLWEKTWLWPGAGLGTCKTTCFNSSTDGSESGVDCGGKVCEKRCDAGQGCQQGSDCLSTYCINNVCTPDYCFNSAHDAFFPTFETDVDCGGDCKKRCDNDQKCKLHGDCKSEYCHSKLGICKESNCDDGVKGPKETDVDCGGSCPAKCKLEQACKSGSDCASGVCVQGKLICAPANACYANIFDGAQNGDETGPDCGGACATVSPKWAPPLPPDQAFLPEKPKAPTFLCAAGVGCKTGTDCEWQACKGGVCAAKCSNGIQNSDEPVVDCGSTCNKCLVGQACFIHDDCGGSLCIDSVCTKHVCANGVQDGDETDLDCGGTCPVGCKKDKNCDADSDCAAEFQCNPVTKTCQSRCNNGVKDDVETDLDCGGVCGKTCNPGQGCKLAADCAGDTTFCSVNNTCVEPGCWDGLPNFTETDTDCGGTQCVGCGVGMACKLHKDCKSGQCDDGICKGDACEDGWLSPGEVGIDCGPKCNKSCPLGSACTVDSECTSGWCDGSFCVASHCENKSQTVAKLETDVDCGFVCGGCAIGQKCKSNVDCASDVCHKAAGLCVASKCFDGKLTFGETDLDCGGPCQTKCAFGEGCKVGADCQSAICTNAQCAAPDCTDGKWSPAEGDIDCGTVCANKCGPGQTCKVDSDCKSNACSGGYCSGPLCKNGAKDGGESDIDCGGPCAQDCKVGQGCAAGTDCLSGACNGTTCVGSTCEDGALTAGKEADVDCGGSCNKRCANGKDCKTGKDCISNQCLGGVCGVPGCLNGKLDFGETDLDCGGKACPLKACTVGQKCVVGTDCSTGFCTSGICTVGSCKTNAKEGDETDVDCGGSCAPCAQSKGCGVGADCQSKLCLANICVPILCANGSNDPGEGGVDCGGNCGQKCQLGKACSVSPDCATGYCAPPGLCAAPTCGNAALDEGESDTDCGAACGGNCKIGKKCGKGADCLTTRCDTFAGTCTNSTCFDAKWTKGETDIDCGGGCQQKCALKQACVSGGDCQSGFCDGQVCVASHCADKRQNVDETDVDCGGALCAKCDNGKGCSGKGVGNSDCLSGQCNGVVCVATACENNDKDGSETDVDCGGDCKTDCLTGQGCKAGNDCQSSVCNGKVCVTTTCFDKLLSTGESDVDCAGPCSALCLSGKKCASGGDCISSVCSKSGLCVLSTCSDEYLNGKETDLDCGGDCATGCAFGKLCKVGADCASGSCGIGGTCVAGPCSDGVKGGSETDIDCGGSCSGKCDLGKTCGKGADCASQVCSLKGFCVASACDDGIKNGGEGDIDCGGSCAAKCDTGKTCGVGGDCSSGLCAADDKLCVATACEDQAVSVGETDVDCGGNCSDKCGAGQACKVIGDCAVGQCVAGYCGCPSGYALDGALCKDVDECGTAAASPAQLQSASDLLALAKLQEQSAIDAYKGAAAVALSSEQTLTTASDACSANPTPTCDQQVAQLKKAYDDAVGLAEGATQAAAQAGKATASAQQSYDSVLAASQQTMAGCSGDATCKNAIGSFSCSCNSGFVGDGKACADVDECKDGSAGCSTQATCANIPGSFACSCKPGYAGDGKVCSDVDECANGAEAVCGAKSTCKNLPGSFECGCASGFGNCDDAVDNGCEVTLTSDVDHCGGCGKACDGDACTLGDSCKDSVCLPGTVTDCDDGLGCTADSCDKLKGCAHVVAENGSPCSDGDACTDKDACEAGTCKSGGPLSCDDSNACTADSCDKAKGCEHKDDQGTPCDGKAIGGSCYKAVSEAGNWTAAESACKAWGGHLVSIGDAGENSAVNALAGATCPAKPFFIGLNDIDKEGSFVWADGTKLDFSYWSAGEPNNAGGAENVVQVQTTQRWKDVTAATSGPCYVCERPYTKPAACDDGDVCTADDVCAGKTCQAGPMNPCGDGDLCTIGSCDAVKGCKQAAQPDGAVCGNGGVCAEGNCLRAGLLTVDAGAFCKLGVDGVGEMDGTVACAAWTSYWHVPATWDPVYGSPRDKPMVDVPLQGKVKGFAANQFHYCAILADGSVSCSALSRFATKYVWPNDQIYREPAAKVLGLPGPASRVFVAQTKGYMNVGCAQVADAVYCWGHVGALGSAAPTTYSSSAVKLQGLPAGIVDFQLGTHSYGGNIQYGMATTANGSLWRWGEFYAGQSPIWPPQQISSAGQVFKSVAAIDFWQRACAIKSGGVAQCWDEVSPPPFAFWQQSAVAKDVIDIETSRFINVNVGTCVLLASGAVYCGGYNGSAQRADGTRDVFDNTAPTVLRSFAKVPLPGDAVALRSLWSYTYGTMCAVLTDGKMVCWGFRSSSGVTLFPGDVASTAPYNVTEVDGLPAVTKDLVPINGGGDGGGCAIDINNIPNCWGAETALGLSTNAMVQRLKLEPLTAGTGPVAEIAASRGEFSDNSKYLGDAQCKVGIDGKAFCWGAAVGPSLAQDNLGAAATKVAVDLKWPVAGVSGCGASTISVDKHHRCYVLVDGSVRCAGDNSCGRLGIGNVAVVSQNQFYSPTGMSAGMLDVVLPKSAMCGLRNDGKVLCSGRGDEGVQGSGGYSHQVTPSPVSGISDAKAIAASARTVCALRASGGVVCWGHGADRSLGSPNYSVQPSPVTVYGQDPKTKQIKAIEGVTAIAGGHVGFCGVTSAGVWCWGWSVTGLGPTSSDGWAHLIDGTAGASKIRGGSLRGQQDAFCADVPKGSWSCFGGFVGNTARRTHAVTPFLVPQP